MLDACFFAHDLNKDVGEDDVLDYYVDVDELPQEWVDELCAFPDAFIETLCATLKLRYPGKERITPVFLNFSSKMMGHKTKIHRLRTAQVGKVVHFDGMVRIAADVLPRVNYAAFTHKGKDCMFPILVKQHTDDEERPTLCPTCGEELNERNVERREDLDILEDYQVLTIEEEPEGLKGRSPERVECQLHGPFTMEKMRVGVGDRVTIMGIFRTRGKPKKNVRERYFEIIGIESKGKNYEDLIISKEDEEKFIEMSKSPTLLQDFVESFAPNIFGYEMEKTALVLQQFGGNLFSPDRRRGDSHILLIGDPGCLTGDTKVALADGRMVELRSLGTEHLQEIEVPLMTDQGVDVATVFHKYEQQAVIKVVTASGKSLRGTYNHPLLVRTNGIDTWRRMDELKVGDHLVIVPDMDHPSHTTIDSIVHIEFGGYEDVYDVEVPKSHRFIANGIVSHNTAKSQLARAVYSVGPHVVRASGGSTSAVGIGAAAVQNPQGGFYLEAGAAVLADRGTLVVEELDKMKEDVKGALHSILEDQMIDVAKGGIVATLSTRCAVLGVMNPKHNRFDSTQSVASQINLQPSLISRFDLVFAIYDKVDEARDRAIAKTMFRSRDGRSKEPKYTHETISAYITYARSRIREMSTSEEAEALMTEHYIKVRKSSKGAELGDTDIIPITHRQLDGAARLAEAHAKMRLSSKVEVQDAEAALSIIDYYLKTMCMDESGVISADIAMGGYSPTEKRRSTDVWAVLQSMANEDKFTKTYTFDEIRAAMPGVGEAKLRQTLEMLSQNAKINYRSDGTIKVYNV